MPGQDILSAEETLFRDDSVFNPDYIPDQFMFRDAQLRELTYALRPALRGGRPSNAFLLGPPATGKTTALRLVFEELEKETNAIIAVHVNCHIHPSPFKIFSEIYRNIFGIQPHDTGIPLAKVQDDVFHRLSRDKKMLLVALDDINYLFENGTANDVVYTILRAHEAYRGVVTAVFAAATEDLMYMLNDRARSIFSPVRIGFTPYIRSEALQILGRRCEAGLYPGVMPAGILENIASQSNDLRFCIELVKQAVMAAEADASKRVGEKHLAKALDSMASGASVGGRERILSILRSNGPAESGNLYRMLSDEKGEKMSYTTFYRILQKMKNEKTIGIEPMKKSRGKTSLIRAKSP